MFGFYKNSQNAPENRVNLKKSEKKSCSDVLLLLLVTFTLIDVFKNAPFNLLVFYQCLLENMYVPIYTGNSGKITQLGKPGPFDVR